MDDDVEIWDGRLIAAARALAGMTVRDLAEAAETTKRVVSDLEQRPQILISPTRRHGYVSRDLWSRITGALGTAGVELCPEKSGGGAGVRWAQAREQRKSTPNCEDD
jgi:hypothetical protein